MNVEDKRPRDLLAVLALLSQHSNGERIITEFIKALQDIWPELDVRFTETPCAGDVSCLPLTRTSSKAGGLYIGGFEHLSEADQERIQNAVIMLALILKQTAQDTTDTDDQPDTPVSDAMTALTDENALLTNILTNFPYSYISVIEKDYTVGFTSGREFKYANLDPNAFIGLALEQVFGEHTAYVKSHYARTFAGETQVFELYINGQHQEYKTTPLFNENDEIDRILVAVENITERKSIELQLQESQEYLAIVFDGTRDTQLLFSYEGPQRFRILKANQAYIDVCAAYDLNVSVEDVVGRTPEDVALNVLGVDNAVAIHTLEHCQRAIESGEIVRYDKSDTVMGKPFHSQITLTPIYRESEDRHYIVYNASDVTAEREANLALQASEARMRMLFEHMTEGYAHAKIITDDQGEPIDCEFIAVNPAFEALTGLNIQDVIGRRITEIFPEIETFQVDWISVLGDVALSGKPTYIESHHALTKSWLATHVFCPILGEVAITVDDITVRKQAEVEMRRNLEVMTQGEAIAKLGYVERNWQTGLGFWSPGLYALLGETPETVDCTHEDFLSYIHPDDLERAERYLRDALRDHVDMDIEFRLIRADGVQLYIHGVGRNFYDETGAPLRTSGVYQDITAYKQTEARLNRTLAREKELADIVREAPIAIAIGHPDDRLSNFNHAFCELTGYTEAELQAIDWTATLTPAKWLAMERDVLNQITLDNPIVHYEKEYIHKDGTLIPIELTVTAVFDAQGAVAHYTGFIMDITERKQWQADLLQAKAEAEESEAKYRLIVENQNDLVVQFNRDLELQYVSPNYCTTFGVNEADVLGTSFMPRVHDDDVARIKRSIESVYDSPHHSSHENRVKTVDGWRWYAWSIKAVLDEDGMVSEIVAVGRDISQRKSYELDLITARDALAQTTRDLEEAQQLSHVGSWVYNPVSQQPEWSPEMFRIWGLDPSEGAPAYEDHPKYIHPDDWDVFDAAVKAAIDKGIPYNLELRLCRPDGDIRTIITICDPLRDENTGEVVGLQGTNQDITERVAAQEQLKAREADLRLSEARYQRAQEIGHVGNWEYDIAQGTLWGSDEAERLFDVRHDRESITLEKIESRIPDREHTHQALIDLIEHDKPYNLEYEVKTSESAEPRILQSVAVLERDETGAPTKVAGVVIDITERARAEQAVHERDMHLRSLVENPAGYVIYRTRLDRTSGQIKVITVSPSFTDVLGLTEEARDDFQRWFTYVHPQDLPEFMAASAAGMHSPFKLQVEVRYHHPEQGLKWFDIRATGIPYPDDPTTIEYANGIIMDITSRKLAEQKLRQSEERYRLYFEHAPMGYQSLSELGHILDVNTSWLRILGYDRYEVIGKWFGDFLHPDQQEVFRQIFQEKNTQKDIITDVQFQLRRKNGTYLIADYTTRIQFDDHGNFVRTHSVFRDVTEQSRAIAALRESEQRFRSYIDSAPDGIFVTNEEGYFEEVNPAMCAITGYAADELLQMRIHDLIELADFEAEPGAITEIHQTGTARGEVEFTNKQDEDRYLSIAAVKLSDTRYLNFVKDSTDRKLAEEQIRASEEKLRLAIDNSPLAATFVDVDGHFLSVNPAYERLVGYTMDELATMTFADITHPEDVSRNQVLFDHLMEGGQSEFTLEKRYIRKDGSLRDVIVHVGAIHDYTGNPVGDMAFIEDITERKQFMRDLQERNAYIETIMDNMPIGLAINTIDDGDVKYMNSLFEEIYGWSREILTNTAIFFEKVFPDPENREKMRTRILADMASGDPERMRWDDLKIVTSTGEERYVYAFNIPLPDQNQMIFTVQDVTARKLDEDTILMALHEKETLLRELYHRTKNNMNVILSMLALQSMRSQNPEVDQIVTEVGNKIQAMALVHQKLYQSQNLSTIALHEYIPEVAQLILRSYDAEVVGINLNVTMEPVYVLIDTAIPCGLILNELMSNAYKHAFPDGRQGEISIDLSRDDQGEITLRVRDDGVGVPEDFDFYAQDTLGVQSIIMITRHQLRGTVKFSGKPGVCCEIQFNDTHYETRV